jgi:large subunit ribosomal protein L3
MTQVFAPDGTVMPATVIKAGPCVVLQAKTAQGDGYEAVQLAFVEEKPAKVNKALAGHYKKAGNVPPTRVRGEVKLVKGAADDAALKAASGAVGGCSRTASVDVVGISRGKGFQGVAKRHNSGRRGDPRVDVPSRARPDRRLVIPSRAVSGTARRAGWAVTAARRAT